MKAKQDQCDDRCTQHDENTIHGRPASRWRAWQEIGAPRRVIRWLRRGVPIMWLTRPPRPYRFAPVAFSPEQEAWFVKERDRFYASGAWAPARQRTHVSPAFLVEKPDKPDGTKDWRLVVNLKFLNRYCRQLRLRYDTLKALRTMARRNEYMFALDVKDGYYHLRLQESEEHFMTFSVVIAGEIQYITCVGLPMGWQHSAYYFVHLMRVVVRHLRAPELAEELRKVRELRKSGALPRILQRQLKAPQDQHRLRILAYVDDFLFLAPTREEALQAMRQVDDLFLRLGVQKHPTKFTPEPVQQLVHLGMDVDLESGRFRVTKKRCAQLRAQAKDLICRATRHQRWVPAKELASFAGLANACLLAVEPARFFLRSIYVALETRSSWEGNCRLDRQALRDLSWWNAFHYEHKWNGAAIWKRPTQAILHCDAAGGKQHGWGGALNGKHTARGAWTPAQAEQHITLLELKAVRFTIETFVHFLRGRVVRLHEDNMGVVGILASSTSKSPKIMREMRKLWWLLDANGIQPGCGVHPIRGECTRGRAFARAGASAFASAQAVVHLVRRGQVATASHRRPVRDIRRGSRAEILHHSALRASGGGRGRIHHHVAAGGQFCETAAQSNQRRDPAIAAGSGGVGHGRRAVLAGGDVVRAAYGADDGIHGSAMDGNRAGYVRFQRDQALERHRLPGRARPAWLHLSAPARAREVVSQVRATANWRAVAVRRMRTALGTSKAGLATLAYWREANTEGTRVRYDARWEAFAAYCDRAGRSALPATPETVAMYLAVLAQKYRNTRKGASAKSYKQIVAAINHVHREFHLETPGGANLVKQVRRGIRAEQAEMLSDTPQRTYLPISVLYQILELAETTTNVSLLADCAAVLFAFVLFARASTAKAVIERDVVLDDTNARLTVIERFFKGRSRRTPSLRVFEFGEHAFPRVRAVLARFRRLRGAVREVSPCFALAGERARQPNRQLARVLQPGDGTTGYVLLVAQPAQGRGDMCICIACPIRIHLRVRWLECRQRRCT
ncbi:tyr recombinase domain-containing protein [Pycnococcus provasolii]